MIRGYHDPLPGTNRVQLCARLANFSRSATETSNWVDTVVVPDALRPLGSAEDGDLGLRLSRDASLVPEAGELGTISKFNLCFNLVTLLKVKSSSDFSNR